MKGKKIKTTIKEGRDRNNKTETATSLEAIKGHQGPLLQRPHYHNGSPLERKVNTDEQTSSLQPLTREKETMKTGNKKG